MTLRDRAASYNAAFAKYRASAVWVVSEGRGAFVHDVLYGVWVLGQNYRATSRLYGAYPPDLLSRYAALFPDRQRVLHACSGSLPPGPYVRVDRHPDRRPDVVGDVHTLPFPDGRFDLAYIDPPYSTTDAVQYATPMVNRARAVRELARVVGPGGFAVWLDTVLPIYRNAQWAVVGRLAIVRSTNHRIRMATIFERRAA